MSTETRSPAGTDRTAPTQPSRPVRGLVGLIAAAIALAVGHLVSAFTGDAGSPAVLVGSQLVDAAPTPVKEVAVRALGTADKPILIAGVVVVTLALGGLIGQAAWRRPQLATFGIVALGAVGMIIALVRPGLGTVGAVPSIAAIVAGGVALQLMVRALPPAPADPVDAEVLTAPGAAGTSRRRVLMVTGGGLVAAALAGGGGVLARQIARVGDAARRTFGLPTPQSPAPAIPAGAQIEGNTPFSTSIEDFYRIDITLVTPRHSSDGWTLQVDGEVDNPFSLTYEELLALPMIERDITLTCVSNEVGGPYVGTARWLGVPFSEILDRARVRPGADMLMSHSLDSGYTCSTPLAALTDGRDAMIAVGMNGEVLPDKNGFPARMVVPGLFGYVSATKWLSRLEVTRFGAQSAYWTDRGWAEQGPILTQSRIDVPDALGTVTRDKPVLAGVAWAQHRGIERVEVQIDDGEWQQATLADEAGIDTWRQWSLRYDGPPGRHTARVRATDRTGETQPEARQPVYPSGATGWHTIQFVVAD